MGEGMKEDKLFESVKRLLMKYEINQQEIIYCAPKDLGQDGEYRDGFVILTRERLYLLEAAGSTGKTRYFRGYDRKREDLMQKETEWVIQNTALNDIDRLWIEYQVSTGTLNANIDNCDHFLAAFTNLNKKDMHRLVREFEQIKNPSMDYEPEEENDDECCPKCGRMYPDQTRKICPKCKDRKAIFIRILRYFKPYRLKLILLLCCIVLTAGLNLIWPYLNGIILYDEILQKNESFLLSLGIKDGRFLTALLMVVLTMLMTKFMLLLLQILQGVLTAQMVAGVIRDMKKDIFRIMGELSIQFYRSQQTGSLMTRVMSDADRVTGFFFDGAPYIIINGFIIIASIIVMLGINWKMTIASILMFPLLTAVSFYLRPKIWVMFGRRHRAERSLNNIVNDNLTGARVVKSFGQEKREAVRFTQYNRSLCDSEIAITYRQNFFQLFYGGAQEIVTIFVWTLGVYFLMKGKNMNLGTLITFVGYLGQLSSPMGFFARIYNWWGDSMNSAERMFEIMDTIPDIQEAVNPVSLKEPRGEIELKQITFGYNVNRPVLKNINIHVPAGSILGIVGRSGAGKTTMVNLISRLYDPQEGSVRIDGIDVKSLSFSDLRRNVAMVSQETYIFMGTVAENISYANQQADNGAIVKAAKLAGAHEFIMQMPDGYDTRIGASKRELSGGERQRISIARAILANPKILILDEATASVDTQTERVIQKALQYLVKGRTTIYIAHRLSTLKDADYLVVIDGGRITEQGTQEGLEAMHGTYYKLQELQTKAHAMKNIE